MGTVVHILGNVSAYEVEFATLTGKTIAVATVLPLQCRPIGHRDINHVREVQAAQSIQRGKAPGIAANLPRPASNSSVQALG